MRNPQPRIFVIKVDDQHVRRIEVAVVQVRGRSVCAQHNTVRGVVVPSGVINPGDGHGLRRRPVARREDQAVSGNRALAGVVAGDGEGHVVRRLGGEPHREEGASSGFAGRATNVGNSIACGFVVHVLERGVGVHAPVALARRSVVSGEADEVGHCAISVVVIRALHRHGLESVPVGGGEAQVVTADNRTF